MVMCYRLRVEVLVGVSEKNGLNMKHVTLTFYVLGDYFYLCYLDVSAHMARS